MTLRNITPGKIATPEIVSLDCPGCGYHSHSTHHASGAFRSSLGPRFVACPRCGSMAYSSSSHHQVDITPHAQWNSPIQQRHIRPAPAPRKRREILMDLAFGAAAMAALTTFAVMLVLPQGV